MQRSKSNNILICIKSGLYGLLLFIVCCVGISFVFLKFNSPEKIYFPLLTFCCAISGFFSGFNSLIKIRENGLINGILSSLVLSIILFSVMIFLYKGFTVYQLVVVLCCVCGGAAGGIIALNLKQKRRKIKDKRR